MISAYLSQRQGLPAGWEVGMTEDGRVYYIDHNTRRTTWVSRYGHWVIIIHVTFVFIGAAIVQAIC